MSRSGFSSRLQTASGMSSGRRSGLGTMLPQGGFQSVNKSLTAQRRTVVPQPGEITDSMVAIFGDYYGYGEQDIEGEAQGVEDVDNSVDLFSNVQLKDSTNKDDNEIMLTKKEETLKSKDENKDKVKEKKLNIPEENMLNIPDDF